MNITINNYNDLLEFIKREDVNSKQATEVVCKALNVRCFFGKSKDEVIKVTEYYFNRFCKNSNSKSPLFFYTKKKTNFNIKDIFSMKQ